MMQIQVFIHSIMVSESGQKSHSTISDEKLVLYYRETGNKELIGTLFKRYSHLVLGVCLHYLGNKEKAEDAVMNIFEKLFDLLMTHRVVNFKSWLFAVSRNHCLMQLRKSIKKRILSLDDYDVFVENSLIQHPDSDDADQEIENLVAAIARLNSGQKQCIRLFYLESYSYQEISASTGQEMNEVKSHIQNGKRNLKLILEGKKKN